nr:hypothetical protein B0A51_13394 [Rachicladosporium sp. CCFEE 5018]
MPIVPQVATAALLLCYAIPARAIATLSPNCTLPALEERSAFIVASPNLRSTFNILWSSLATIAACTYCVLHFDVPRQHNGRDPGWRGDLKWLSKGLGMKLKWCIVAILAPEYYLMIAAMQYDAARRLQRRLQDLDNSVHGGRQWSINEAFFISMGGYGVSYWSDSTDRKVAELWTKSFTHLLELAPSLVLPELLDADEVTAQSKTDMFTKSIVLAQILYFVVAVISRWIEHLPVSPLEVATLAFTVCSFCTHGLFWHKPQGVTAVTTIALRDNLIPEYLTSVLQRKEHHEDIQERLIATGTNPAWEDWLGTEFLRGSLLVFILACASAVFSAIHLAAWNSTFPTAFERIVWRVATLVSALTYMICWLCHVIMNVGSIRKSVDVIKRSRRRHVEVKPVVELASWIFVVTTISYVLARLIIIVEMFRSLAYLPLEAYITSSWPANVPHFG